MKKLFGVIAIAAIAAAAGWNFCQNQDKVELSDLALANIEALARNEGSGKTCYTYCCQTNYNACLDALHAEGDRYKFDFLMRYNFAYNSH